MDDTNSIVSDVIGSLPPLCPNELAPDTFTSPVEKKDSPLDTTREENTIGDITDEEPTKTHRPGESDVTASSLADTIHYLSPVSPLSPRTVYEGDIDYIKLLTKEEPGVADISSVSSSTISCVEPHLQRTIAIVKPEAMPYQDVILRAITKAGFSIVDRRVVHFTPEEISEFFCQYYGSPAFPHQVVSMSADAVLVLSLADVCAVSKWKDLIGPDKILREDWFYPMSMRVRFGLMEAMPNAIHASDNLTDAYKENRYVFPRNVLEPIVEALDKVTDFCGIYVNPTLLQGLTQLVKVKPRDPLLYLADWLVTHNPYQPKYSDDINLLPT